MQTILRAVRIRFLRRITGSSVSMLTAKDIEPEPHPELQEQYAGLLDCVWRCEARERQSDRMDWLRDI